MAMFSLQRLIKSAARRKGRRSMVFTNKKVLRHGLRERIRSIKCDFSVSADPKGGSSRGLAMKKFSRSHYVDLNKLEVRYVSEALKKARKGKDLFGLKYAE